jgi:hypothetical protein
MKADLDAKMAHAESKHDETLSHVRSSAAEEVVWSLFALLSTYRIPSISTFLWCLQAKAKRIAASHPGSTAEEEKTE